MSKTPKPAALLSSHRTKQQNAERREAELSWAPASELPDMPAELKGHAYAAAKYTRLMGLYAETIGEIVTAFDLDLLVDYCLTLEEAAEFAALRGSVLRRIAAAEKSRKKNAGEAVGFLAEKVLEIDAALRRARAQAQKFREHLYLSPLKRAGKAPPRKPAQPEADEMDELMSDV